MDLAGKSIIVTGATSGIGRASALKLAACGARLTLVGRNPERGTQIGQEVQALGANARLELVDVMQPGAMQGIIKRTVASYGRVDGAVLAAAQMPSEDAMMPLVRLEDAAIERDLISEVRATVHALRALLQQMVSQPPADGSIVVVTSINGLGSSAGAALYSASKAASISLAKAAALEHARSGIRVNALALGPFDTPMLALALERQSAAGNSDEIRRMYENHVALGRIGRPEEAAEAIAWLCSPSSSYMTGSTVILDGGMTAIAR
jgi:NAD(P)-dependent dehydrogenase (short-subunit alcohol dehydrogenase family)